MLFGEPGRWLLEYVSQVVAHVLENDEQVVESFRLGLIRAREYHVDEACYVNTYLAGRKLSQDANFTKDFLSLIGLTKDVADQLDRNYFASFLVAGPDDLAVCA